MWKLFAHSGAGKTARELDEEVFPGSFKPVVIGSAGRQERNRGLFAPTLEIRLERLADVGPNVQTAPSTQARSQERVTRWSTRAMNKVTVFATAIRINHS